MIKTIIGALALSTVIAGTAQAGGFSREGVNTQGVLFNNDRVVFNFGLSLGLPRREADNATGSTQSPFLPVPAGGSTSTSTADNFFTLDAELKFRVTDQTDCLIRGSMPYLSRSSVSDDFVGRFQESRFDIDSRAVDLTCAYKFGVGENGVVRAIGGVRGLDFDAQRSNFLAAGVAPAPGENINTFNFDNDGLDFGYRVGVSYEIPSILLRAQAIYESEIDVDLEGTQTYTNVGLGIPVAAAPVTTALTLPQSMEVRLQSGVNQRTLVFAGIKWTDWSTLNELVVNGSPLLIRGGQTTLTTGYRDGLTVNAGVGYALTDDVNLLGSLTWDRGIGGAFSDSYAIGVGAQFDVTEEVKISVGSSLTLLTAQDNDARGGGGSPFTSSISESGNDVAYGFGFRFQYALK